MSASWIRRCFSVALLLGVAMCGNAGLPQGRPATPAMEFVHIQPGTFIMGCSRTDDGCVAAETPAHQVRITKPFEIGKHEVTQAQWISVMETNPSDTEGGDLPVDQVSWTGVQQFIGKLNARRDGYRYRLPTEAEWEYAARAGSVDAYHGSLDDIAWYNRNSGNGPHPVGQRKPNAWGLYDMHGNAWEWVQDWFDEKYYASTPVSDPKGPAAGVKRVVRGGSWSDNARLARVSARLGVPLEFGNYDMGFRCARENQGIREPPR